MGIMAVGRIIVLSVLITQTLSAPSGCIESCNFYHTSYRSHSASGGQDHAGLIQSGTHLNDHDYAKPGNWTEHNQYRTEDGHGKVHEERGQYVEGSKKVRYFKKNYTSSYGTGNINGLGATELGDLSAQQRYDSVRSPSSQYFDSQSTYGQSGQTVAKEAAYNTVHSQQTQSSSTRIDSKSERLEDFGDHSEYSQVNQRAPNVSAQTIDTQHHIETTPGNWSRVDSYRTDGGHGRVFEEEGQYVTGPKKVRYYKKNYTSGYSTSGVPQTADIGSTRLSELHSELQRNVQRELENLRREFHESSSSGHIASDTSVGSTVGLSQVGSHSNDLQTAESDAYRQQSYRPSTYGTTHHYTEQQQHRETYTGTRQPLTYTYPTSNTYGTESQRTYQDHQTYASQAVPQSGYPTTYVQTPVTRDDQHQTSLQNAHSSSRHRHMTDEIRHAEVFGAHQQSGVAQNQLLADNTQHVYNPGYGAYPSRHGESRHYEEHWSSSSGGHVAPERTADYVHSAGQALADRTHYDRDAYNEHRGRYHSGQGHSSHTAHASESSYDSAFRTSSGQHVIGSLGLSHAAPGAADCTEETQHHQQETRYHRKYKRDDQHGNVQQHQAAEDFSHQELSQIADDQQSEDLTQQTQGSDDLMQQTSGKLELGQQLEDLTQQTEGQLEFGQQTVGNHHLEDLTQQSEQFTQQTQGSDDDLTQQTSGKLGQQTVHGQQLEDLTQQTEGQLEFGQQTVGNQHLEDLTQQSEQFTQQTQGSDDHTQQTSGKLEFGQQTVGQNLEDLTQQTQGQLEFGQQTVGNQHLEDLTQQSEQFTQQTQRSDDHTQQTSGKLEFGQQTVGQNLEDLTQQTQGHLEFGQQTVGNQHLEDLTQQSEQFTQQTQGSDDYTQQTSGKLEFGQQTVGQNLEDLTQQTQGQLEFGQQTVGNQHLEDLTQQSEQFTQQTQGSDDHTQQTSGKLEFGQQTVGQNLEDLTQQTQGHLEFGQQTVGNQHLEDLTQQSEQFTQQGSDDYTQQSSGKLKFGQNLEDLTQQTQGQLEFGQQTVGNQHFGDLTQQSEQFTQQTQGSDDYTQQTNGKLEFGQQSIDSQQLEDFMQNTEGQLELGQRTDNQELEKSLQHTEQIEQRTARSNDLMQQTVNKFEGGHHIGNQHLEDLTQQSEQFVRTEQTQGSNDFTQQTVGKLEFGQQQAQSTDEFTEKNQHLTKFNQESEDLAQQTGRFDDFTQQTMGQFGQPKDFAQQESEDLTQQTGGFDDFTQQTSGHLEHHQQQNQHSGSGWWETLHDARHMGQFSHQTDWNTNNFPHQHPSHTNKPSDQLEQMSQQTGFDQDFTQQTDHQSATSVPKPAPKPKPRPRYQHGYTPSDKTDTSIDDAHKPIEVTPEPDIDTHGRTHDYHRTQTMYLQNPLSVLNHGEENIDRLHWIHKSNDAVVGLTWHYTYHPSDLTNVENTHYYGPNIDLTSQQQMQETQQQSKQFDFDQQETQDKHTFEQDQQLGSSQQVETSHFDETPSQNSEEIPAKVIPLQQNSQQTELEKQPQAVEQKEESKIEPRILEAFGGGPYDPSRTDDIYSRVTIHPSATLPPIAGEDPWDIREKPREMIMPWMVTDTLSTANTPKPIDTTTPVTQTTTQASSFWNRLGNRITNTYGKAKEKAKEIFG